MRWLAPWIVLVLVGCGASEARDARSANDEPPSSDESSTNDESSSGSAGTSTALPAGCPATFGGNVDCEAHPGLHCGYPEGQCYCGEPRRCSGVPPQPEPDRWLCDPRPPPCPEIGTACQAGQVGCSPWCCGMGVVCVNGVWTAQDVPCPP